MDIKTANKLQALRKANGYSQDALAEKLGISRQSISKWERGESSPDTNNLIALAQIYGISIDDIINSEKDIIPTKKPEEATEPKKEKKKGLYSNLGKALFIFPMPLIIIAIYVISSMITKMWHPMWIMFVLIPIYYHLAGACYTKSQKGFLFALPVPEIVIMMYLSLGLFCNAWAMSAVLFIIIPIYYWMVAMYKKK